MKLKLALAGILLVLFPRLGAAQTPNVTFQWTPNPTSDNVTGYNLYIDTATILSISPVVNVTCNCIQATATLSNGSHTVQVTALNVKYTDDPSNPPGSVIAISQESLPATVKFTINGKPGKPLNIVIK